VQFGVYMSCSQNMELDHSLEITNAISYLPALQIAVYLFS